MWVSLKYYLIERFIVVGEALWCDTSRSIETDIIRKLLARYRSCKKYPGLLKPERPVVSKKG